MLNVKSLSICLSLALVSACTNGNPFDNPDEFVDLNANSQFDGFDAVGDPTSASYFAQAVGDKVLFAVDQSTLSEGAKTVLIKQAQWLNANAGYAIIVEGHADEQGTREYNLALGARRANAVQQFLISQGVDSTRLKTVSYGKERPVELCSTESCYSQNRRSVTRLTGLG
ncbi:MAG: peptidoglycan-associated lipoprotein Pal [Paracoccaceae bacterium]